MAMQTDPYPARPLRIGTRGSPLALAQAKELRARLQQFIGGGAVKAENVFDGFVHIKLNKIKKKLN